MTGFVASDMYLDQRKARDMYIHSRIYLRTDKLASAPLLSTLNTGPKLPSSLTEHCNLFTLDSMSKYIRKGHNLYGAAIICSNIKGYYLLTGTHTTLHPLPQENNSNEIRWPGDCALCVC